MKRTGIIVLFYLSTFGVFINASTGQDRDPSTYDWARYLRLIQTNGTSYVDWLPKGMGYLHSETVSGGETLYYRVNPATNERAPLFDTSDLQTIREGVGLHTNNQREALPFNSFDYVKGGDAITFEVEDRFFLFDLNEKSLRELRRPKVTPQPGTDGLMRSIRSSQLWNGSYSPDMTGFAYVKDYDLFYVDTRTGEEKRLTADGSPDLLNGRPDWVYPEEFDQTTAYWFSPDSRKIAFLQFDESAVYEYPIVNDLAPEAHLEVQHYPKPGEPNPTVRLFIIDLDSHIRVEVQTNSGPDTYIVRPEWREDGRELLFQRLNRNQNRLELLAADPATGVVRTILVEEEDTFINHHDDLAQIEEGERFLWSSERSGWRHIYLYDFDGSLEVQLTKGEGPVVEIAAVDEEEEWVYFTANREEGLERHFFRVKFDGSELQQLTTDSGTHTITMDSAGRYYTDYFSSFTHPPIMTVHNARGERLDTLMTTDTSRLDEVGLTPVELVTVKAADGVTDLHGLLFKPTGFDSGHVYPLIVSAYGGPHSKSVQNRYYHGSIYHHLAQLGFMVWTMDNRGQTNRGKRFEDATYLKLGQVDLDDQAAGVRQITARSYIDGSRVGIFGSSYGGYMTAMALLRYPDLFHVGIAGSSVTDWKNYDTIYTERYMRTPRENQEGYTLGSTLPLAENLQGKLLLTHGAIDNNVHPGNTFQLVNALVNAGRQFDLMIYPGHRHGFGGNAGRHHNKLQIDYLLEHLYPSP